MKKMIISTVLLLSSLSLYAAPLILKCNTSNGQIRVNIQSLVGDGCNFDRFRYGEDKRYSIELCDGVDATGVVEVLDIDGNWIVAEELSTEVNCRTWRNISTNYSCPRRGRYRHSGRCD